MAYFTYTAAGARTETAKGDIRDVITMLAVDEHPILAAMRAEGTKDIYPQAPEDALSGVNNANAYAENAAAPAASDTARTLNANYVQRMLVTAEVSDIQNAVAQYGVGGDELAYQTVKKMREFLRDAEAILVSDQAAQAPTAANSRIGKMAGLTTLIVTNTSGTFSQANYNTMLTNITGYGGNPTVLYMDATRKIAADAWTTTYTRFSDDFQTIRKPVRVYQSDLGPDVAFKWHPYLPQTIVTAGAVALLLDLSLWVRKELIPVSRKELPDTGAGPARMLQYVWCPLCLAEKGNGEFTG